MSSMRQSILRGSSRVLGMGRLRIRLIVRWRRELGYRKLERCTNDLELGGVRLGVGIGLYVDREEGTEYDEYDDSDSN